MFRDRFFEVVIVKCIMIVVRTSEQRINARPDGGVFSYILSDGIFYRRNGSSRDLVWRWPDEFICAPFRFDVRYDLYPFATITEEHPEVVEPARRRRTYLDLLPLDMRRGVLEPMCRRVILSRKLVPEDAVPISGTDAGIVAALRGVRPCSPMELIDGPWAAAASAGAASSTATC